MNRKGFTLIELLAVIIILGIIMMIAVPNVLGMLDRNKKNTLVEHAKTMINQAEYTLRRDTEIDFPSAGKAIIMTLKYLNTDDVSTSPYDIEYSPTKSFVAVVNTTSGGVTEYKYYAHLVACDDAICSNSSQNSINKNRGINLTSLDKLSGANHFEVVKEGSSVDVSLVNNQSRILSIIGASSIENVFQ